MIQAIQEEAENAHASAWERFIKKYYREQALEVSLREDPVLVVDWHDLNKHDESLSEYALDHPLHSLAHAEAALDRLDFPVDPKPRIRVRIRNVPKSSTVRIRDIRNKHLGRLIAVRGLVKLARDVKPRVTEAMFQCNVCGAFIKEPQDEDEILKEPLECYEEQGGGGHEARFRFISTEIRGNVSKFVNTQLLEVQEYPETLKGGEQPQRLEVVLQNDLCELRVKPGDRITLTGRVKLKMRRVHGKWSQTFDLQFDAIHLEREQEELEDVVISPEDEQEIVRTSRRSDVYDLFRACIAPHLFGFELEKETLMLQLFGGVRKVLPTGAVLRGDSHVLFVGDPGVAKSQLIKYMTELAPRAVYTSGKSASSAGLTAAAIKDEADGGRWTLEAGAMVLADGGLLCVDEFDKMGKNDQAGMHEAMEQQTISVSKAGLSGVTLQARCSVTAAANPKSGRFDDHLSIADQLDFPPAILSRFDVIFVVRDKADKARDLELSRFVLEQHQASALAELRRRKPDAVALRDFTEEPPLSDALPLSKEFIRMYVAHAKRTCIPVLTNDARDVLTAYYAEIRSSSQPSREGDAAAIPLTARQLEAIQRLAEASARVRLSDLVLVEDAERAIRIVDSMLKRIAGTATGGLDIDKAFGNVSSGQRSKVNKILAVIKQNSGMTPHGVEHAVLLDLCQEEGLGPELVESTLEKLVHARQAQVAQPRSGYWKWVH